MAKSADAFRTISEVADWLETPAHVLRFWESKFSQVKPVKRAGGRRYYRPADMQLLSGIKKLLHDDGMTIKGVQKILREQGIKHVAALSQPLDGEADDFAEAGLEVAPEAPAETAQVLNFQTGSATETAEDETPDTPPAENMPSDSQGDAAPDAPPEMTPSSSTETHAQEVEEADNGDGGGAGDDVADERPAPDEEEHAEPVPSGVSQPQGSEEDRGHVEPVGATPVEAGTAPETEADTKTPPEVENPPAAPRPAIVSVPDDPPDTTPAPTGLLTELARFSGALDAEQQARLATLCDRLRAVTGKGRS